MERIYIKRIIGREKELTLLSHVILHCSNEVVIAGLKGHPGTAPEEDKRYIEVEFKMNGVEVKLSSYLNHLEKDMDRMIREKARDLVLSKLTDVTSAIAEMSSEAEGAIKRIIKDRLNVPIPEEW